MMLPALRAGYGFLISHLTTWSRLPLPQSTRSRLFVLELPSWTSMVSLFAPPAMVSMSCPRLSLILSLPPKPLI
jgi:hypothetical protein